MCVYTQSQALNVWSVALTLRWRAGLRKFTDAVIFSDPHAARFVYPAAMPRADKGRLLNQQRLLKEATDLFGRTVIAEGLKISEATLDGWMSGSSEMPDTMLIALAHLLVKLAGKDRK